MQHASRPDAKPRVPAQLARIHSLAVTHPDSPRTAPQRVSLEVERGDVLLVLGPSGCGKSTLTLALSGLIPNSIEAATEGEVWLGGDRINELPAREPAARVAMVFQDPDAQIVTTTVMDEVAFGAENLGVPAAEIERRIEYALRRVRLWERRDEHPDVLSGGEKQRLAIAAAIAQGAPLLVLDEPTANLDPRSASEVYDVLAELTESSEFGIVLVEHNLDEALRIVNRVLVLDQQGREVCTGTPEEVFVSNATLLDELGVWRPLASLAAEQLRQAGLPVAHPLSLTELVAQLERALPDADVPAETRPPLPAASPPLISVRQLTVTRGGRQLVGPVSLDIPRGAFVALLGPNGAGKTTLLQAIAGIEPPPRGTVSVAEQDVHRLHGKQLRDTIGYVFQNPEHQFLASTVADELALELRARGMPDAELAPLVAESLERFGLTEHAEQHPFLLSGGQKRRLSVATALVSGAQCLILDEPTYGQDRNRASELVSVLQQLNDAGTTVVMATHDLQLAAEYADHLVVMTDGHIAAAGPTATVLESGALEKVGLEMPPLARVFAQAPAPLRGIYRMQQLVDFAAERGAR